MSVIPLDHRGLQRVEVYIKLANGSLLTLQQVQTLPRRGQWKLTKNGDIYCHHRRGEVVVVKEFRRKPKETR